MAPWSTPTARSWPRIGQGTATAGCSATVTPGIVVVIDIPYLVAACRRDRAMWSSCPCSGGPALAPLRAHQLLLQVFALRQRLDDGLPVLAGQLRAAAAQVADVIRQVFDGNDVDVALAFDRRRRVGEDDHALDFGAQPVLGQVLLDRSAVLLVLQARVAELRPAIVEEP